MPEEDKKMVPLDTSGPDQEVDIEETKDESVVETEAPKQETETVEQETTQQEDGKLEEYSKGVQARIAKLTRKMREAERREQAAIEYARGVEEKRKILEKKFEKTDSEKVTAMVPLLLASSKFDIMGLALSFRLAVLLDLSLIHI